MKKEPLEENDEDVENKEGALRKSQRTIEPFSFSAFVQKPLKGKEKKDEK